MKKHNNVSNKKTALVTGASSGIGYELSKLLARDGYNLVLVARNKEKLEQVANELREKFNISPKVIPKDLSVPTAPQEIFDELKRESFEIDILVNNAGFGLFGPFSETNLKEELQMIHVNIISLTHLTKLFLREMFKKGHGMILNVASTASFVPRPYNAVYGATKAYVLSFSEAIAEEVRGTGITVTTLCPGYTKTEFHKRAKIENRKARGMDARTVAEIGYRALLKGKRIVIPGISNSLRIFLSRWGLIKKCVRFLKRFFSPKWKLYQKQSSNLL